MVVVIARQRLRRAGLIMAGALLALSLLVGARATAPARATSSASPFTALAGLDAEIQLVTAGPGTITISPAADGPAADCKVNEQQYEPGSETTCIQHYEPGTRVTLDAVPDDAHSFVGWGDFDCPARSTRCTLTLAAGTRYVTARFSPVTIRISAGADQPFGLIKITPKPLHACSLNGGDPCEYTAGTVVTLRREHPAAGFFWIGACAGNRGGKLNADVCQLRLQSNELVGAGYKEAGEIPPALGSGIAVAVSGSGRGTVTGGVINGSRKLKCGARCVIAGLQRTDYVRLNAVASRGSHFTKWNDANRQQQRIVGLAATNRLRATFVRN